jgi:hypothetical protein
MSGRDFLGEFAHIIALALLRLEAQAYGVTVRQEIEFRPKRDVSIGPSMPTTCFFRRCSPPTGLRIRASRYWRVFCFRGRTLDRPHTRKMNQLPVLSATPKLSVQSRFGEIIERPIRVQNTLPRTGLLARYAGSTSRSNAFIRHP